MNLPKASLSQIVFFAIPFILVVAALTIVVMTVFNIR
jgi:hypothetical protein